MASEVNSSFQDLNRFNFSWVLTQSPWEKVCNWLFQCLAGLGCLSPDRSCKRDPPAAPLPQGRLSSRGTWGSGVCCSQGPTNPPPTAHHQGESSRTAPGQGTAHAGRGTGPGGSTEWGVLRGTGMGPSWAQNPAPHLQPSVLWAPGKASPETFSRLALKCVVFAE